MKNLEKQSLYKDHKIFYTDPVTGKFNNIRLTIMSLIALSFFAMPWIGWKGKQAILFDISYSRLYFFNLTFWPQDFVLLAIFLILVVLLLFAVTVYAGRVWCGFVCPQSVWIKMGAFFTRVIEGKRNKRKKLDNSALSKKTIAIKATKHAVLILLSFITAFTFVGYFVPFCFLLKNLMYTNFINWSFFWILFFTLLTYFNIGWFQEQFCFLVCPYARLQSIMFDENTMIVAYDEKRGEKRGPRNKNADLSRANLGDCVDCKQCVNCCPVGIDIRDGLQIECISCAACIDACNDVMSKMAYPKGLIRYMKEKDLKNNYSANISYIKLLSYSAMLFILITLFIYTLANRPLIQFNVNKSQLQLFNINKENLVENTYLLKITNKTQNQHTYTIILNDERFKYVGINKLILDGEDSISIDVKLVLCDNKHKSRFLEVSFCVVCNDQSNAYSVSKKSQFITPIQL